MTLRSHTHTANQHIAYCRASTHQGDLKLFQSKSVGCQCLPNSLIACVMASLEQPDSWTTMNMDYILCEGDKLYKNINVEHELLLPSDLPTCIHTCNKIFYVARGKEAFGSFVGNKSKTNTILLTLCAMVQSRTTSALLCLGDKTGSSAIALFSTNSTSIYIFDSHSQNNCGMPCANGTSILMKFDNIVNAVSYICELAHALSARLFHWTFCHAVPDAQCECGITVPQMGILLEEDIMKLYSDFLPLLSQQKKKQNKRKYYASYKKRVRQSETPEQTAQR